MQAGKSSVARDSQISLPDLLTCNDSFTYNYSRTQRNSTSPDELFYALQSQRFVASKEAMRKYLKSSQSLSKHSQKSNGTRDL